MQVIENNNAGFRLAAAAGTAPSDPGAVLDDPDLEPFEKRAILSSWASDLYAVESCPLLRDVPGVKKALHLSDILEALQALDADDDPPPRGGAAMRLAGVRLPRTLAAFRRRR